MTNKSKISLLSLALGALLLPAGAQNTPQSTTPTTGTPTQAAPNKPDIDRTINQRKEQQQDRIAAGVGSGELTANEAGKLEKQEGQLNQEERDMRKLDGGQLTTADKAALRQQQNNISKEIHQDQTNNKVQNTNPQSKLGKREENQQDRISQGIKSGQLTAGEANHLESQQAALNHEIAKDKNANGGKLTQQEKAQVNRQQNQLSKQIYKDKHNGKHQAH